MRGTIYFTSVTEINSIFEDSIYLLFVWYEIFDLLRIRILVMDHGKDSGISINL